MTENRSRRLHILREYPEGTMSAQEFAVRHGVRGYVLRQHIIDGIGDDRIEVTPLAFGADGHQVHRYLTPEQQGKALAFWDKHGVPYRKRESL